MNNRAWQSHPSGCECAGCQIDRDMVQLTSEMLPEMPESPSMGRRLIGAIGETLAWLSLVGFVLLLVRCAP